MSRTRLGLLIATLFLTGCYVDPETGLPVLALPGHTITSVADTVSENLAGHVPPAVANGAVRVHIVNESGRDVDLRITMRVAGERVHFSGRNMASGAEDIIIGPDRADTVLVEATLLGESPESLPMQTFTLGDDFMPGDTILVILSAPVVTPECQSSDELSVAIEGLEEDVVGEAGMLVTFDVRASAVTPAARLRVFADADGDPDNGSELVIADDLAVADRVPLTWDTVGITADVYVVYAEVRDGLCFLRTEASAGRVIIEPEQPPLQQPTIALERLDTDVEVFVGEVVTFDVVTANAAVSATVTVFADPDDDPASGNEIVVLVDTPAADLITVAWDTLDITPGTYLIYADLNNGGQFLRAGPATGRVLVVALPEPELAFEGLDQDVAVTIGDVVTFDVVTADSPAEAVVDVFADPDDDPTNGNETVIAAGLPAVERATVNWDTAAATPGTYTVRGDLRAAGAVLDTAVAPGRVLVQVPMVRIEGLDADVEVLAGDVVSFDLVTGNAPAGAVVDVFVDPDADPANGNEIVIAAALPAAARTTVDWNTTGVASAAYVVYANLRHAGTSLASFGPSDGRVIVQELAVWIAGLDQDLRINAGTLVEFDVLTTGASPAGRVSVFADPDDDPTNGNELPISADLPAAGLIEIDWNTAGLAPGAYAVYADLSEGPHWVRYGPSLGRVLSNAQPQLVVTDPRDGLAVTWGRSFMIAWAGQDDDDDALITIFLDVDDVLNGNEQILRSDISEDDIYDRDHLVDTELLSLEVNATYFVGGIIDDGLSTMVAYAGPVCVVDRLVGRFMPSELWPGEIATVHGNAGSRVLGRAIDLSRDLDGDGHVDLLLGDPQGLPVRGDPGQSQGSGGPSGQGSQFDSGGILIPPGGGGDTGRGGVVYYHEGGGVWPTDLSVDDLDLRIHGLGSTSSTGMRVALIGSVDSGSTGEILIGAPLFTVEGTVEGLAYVLNGDYARSHETINLNWPNPPNGTTFQGSMQEQAGLDVAALGDFNGDGHADYAIAGAAYAVGRAGDEGRVAIVSGDGLPWPASLDMVGSDIAGALLYGTAPDGMAGYAVCGVADLDTDELDEVLIGAPFAAQGRVANPAPGPGLVYLVFGDSTFFEGDSDGDVFLGDVGGFIPGHVFVGENDGDLAGAAVASADFNADGWSDMLIGAPGHDAGRGRVYLVYGVAPLSADPWPPVVALSRVGVDIAGAVFDGIAPGDQLGFAVAALGAFNATAGADLLLGAPGSEALHGSAYGIYAGPHLAGNVPLIRVGTCDLLGWQLVGELAGGGTGAAVSGGAQPFTGQPSVAGIGAPGDGSVTKGIAHVLFGLRYGPGGK
ncbi:MAG: integrin alpha [Planctomycetes bacterium]|nr:integrin alpha [Planctomycetota bacterium]